MNPACTGTPYSFGAYPSGFCDIYPSTAIMSACFNSTHNVARRWYRGSCSGSADVETFQPTNVCLPSVTGGGVYVIYNCSEGAPAQKYYGAYSTDFATAEECQAGPAYAQRQNFNDFSCRPSSGSSYSYLCNSTGYFMKVCTDDSCTANCTINPCAFFFFEAFPGQV
jgi:hypothetical protein